MVSRERYGDLLRLPQPLANPQSRANSPAAPPWKRFFRAHHVRAADVIDTRLQAIKSAMALTTDDGVITPNVLLVQALVAQLRVTLQAIADFDNAIAQRAQEPSRLPVV